MMINYKKHRSFNFHRQNYFKRQIELGKSDWSAVSVVLICLIFVSIVPYAGADIWTEAAVLITIFILAAVSLFQQKSLETEYKYLLLPFFALSFYSLAQGFITLFVQSGFTNSSPFLPYSFDLTASFWCALKFFGLGMFISLILNNFRRNIKFLIWSLIVTGFFFALFGIFRYLTQASFPEMFGWLFPAELPQNVGFGTFINQNHFAFLMLMTFGLSLGLTAYGNLKPSKRLPLLIGCLITWTALVLTGSRGGIISSFVEIAVLILFPLTGVLKNNAANSSNNYPLKKTALKRLAGFAVITVLLIAGIILIGQERVVHRFEEIPSQLEGVTNYATFRRIDVWEAATLMIKERGLFGVGFGGFRFAVSQYIDISGALTPKQAHNDYLEFIASGGAFAFICGIWFLYKFFSTLKKRFSEPSARFENSARIGAACAIAGIIVHNFFDFGLQLIANQLYLAAIIVIAVYKKNNREKKIENVSAKTSTKNLIVQKLVFSTILIGLIVVCAGFGYSRRQLYFAKKNLEENQLPENFIQIDAEFYETKALVNQKIGNYSAVLTNLRMALHYRPKDYKSWLEFGKTLQFQNQSQEAEIAYRQAIELAPRYGEPHFFYGKFLLGANRSTEGFPELVYSFKRNPQYFKHIVELAWRETSENAGETIKLLSPLNSIEKEMLTAFFLEKENYAAISEVACREEDLSQAKRNDLITKLFEKKQFFLAYKIYKRNCGLPNDAEGNFEDGDFESGEIQKGNNFGWHVGHLPDNVEAGFDEEIPSNSRSSFGYIFDGNAETSLPLLSQIIIVKKNHLYHLSFDYQTQKIISGGVPVLQIISRQLDGEVKLKELTLETNNNKWTVSSMDFQTNGQTESLEIRLTRRPCNQPVCPIFGRLWLDNFVLK